ncbi:hypothetical protein NC651_032770 [Populus alba x Populus x berolinensis]|nr:hypothetical protein NC651_032770 [Populus alba x Populus x berolinensis]
MATKKKKSVSHKSHLKQQASHLINAVTVLALGAPPLSPSVHVTAPPNSNSTQTAPVVLPNQISCPVPPLISSNHNPTRQDPSPSINHIFADNYSDDEELDEVDKDMDLDSSSEDFMGGSKIFSSAVSATNANNS